MTLSTLTGNVNILRETRNRRVARRCNLLVEETKVHSSLHIGLQHALGFVEGWARTAGMRLLDLFDLQSAVILSILPLNIEVNSSRQRNFCLATRSLWKAKLGKGSSGCSAQQDDAGNDSRLHDGQ